MGVGERRGESRGTRKKEKGKGQSLTHFIWNTPRELYASGRGAAPSGGGDRGGSAPVLLRFCCGSASEPPRFCCGCGFGSASEPPRPAGRKRWCCGGFDVRFICERGFPQTCCSKEEPPRARCGARVGPRGRQPRCHPPGHGTAKASTASSSWRAEQRAGQGVGIGSQGTVSPLEGTDTLPLTPPFCPSLGGVGVRPYPHPWAPAGSDRGEQLGAGWSQLEGGPRGGQRAQIGATAARLSSAFLPPWKYPGKNTQYLALDGLVPPDPEGEKKISSGFARMRQGTARE